MQFIIRHATMAQSSGPPVTTHQPPKPTFAWLVTTLGKLLDRLASPPTDYVVIGKALFFARAKQFVR